MTGLPPIPDSVVVAFDAQPTETRDVMLNLRRLIFDVAATLPNVGPSTGAISETLKWGQPSYAVPTGTPLRLGVIKAGKPALFVHCQTRVVADARAVLGADLVFEGNRAILVPEDVPFPEAALRQVIHAALTYRTPR